MKFKREKRESREVAKPPPEAADRVDGGGPWGPTQFDLPERTGNTQAIVIVVLVGAAILLVLAVLWVLVYYRIT
jgi:hypothetical protein